MIMLSGCFFLKSLSLHVLKEFCQYGQNSRLIREFEGFVFKYVSYMFYASAAFLRGSFGNSELFCGSKRFV